MIEFLENTATSDCAGGSWHEVTGRRFHVAISKDEDGRFSVIALNLPGVGSSGDDADDAMESFREAARAAVESYQATDTPIPWKQTTSNDTPPGANHKWIIIDV